MKVREEWYVNFTLFLAILRERFWSSPLFFAPISFAISSICQMELSKLKRTTTKAAASKKVLEFPISFCLKIKISKNCLCMKKNGVIFMLVSYNVVISCSARVIKHHYALLFIWKSDTANHNNSINKLLSRNVKACFTSILYKHSRYRVSHIIINL